MLFEEFEKEWNDIREEANRVAKGMASKDASFWMTRRKKTYSQRIEATSKLHSRELHRENRVTEVEIECSYKGFCYDDCSYSVSSIYESYNEYKRCEEW